MYRLPFLFFNLLFLSESIPSPSDSKKLVYSLKLHLEENFATIFIVIVCLFSLKTMNLWHDLPSGNKKNINVVIEIPKLSHIKYELDKNSGIIKIDRTLPLIMRFPINYGFVPRTLWYDSDPLDVLVLSSKPHSKKSVIEARPVGMLNMIDGGKSDVKIFAVPAKDFEFKKINDISDIESELLKEIQHFFRIYKKHEKKNTIVKNWEGKQKALKIIKKSIKLYKEKYRETPPARQ
ncbi:MAG: inorganic diphosphatase [Candidatus Paceibacterota bacterium]